MKTLMLMLKIGLGGQKLGGQKLGGQKLWGQRLLNQKLLIGCFLVGGLLLGTAPIGAQQSAGQQSAGQRTSLNKAQKNRLRPATQTPKKAATPKKTAAAPKTTPKKRSTVMIPKGTFAIFNTTMGTFKAELYPQYAPRTVENFIQLAEGKKIYKSGHKTKKINYPFYNGLTFHRVVDRFMIQGGCPKGTGRGSPGYTFADEFSTYLKHDKPGLLSMANAGPDTNGSQFFVTVAPAEWLDNKHSIFGRVVEGYSVVEKISQVKADKNSKPLTPVKINSVKIVRTK